MGPVCGGGCVRSQGSYWDGISIYPFTTLVHPHSSTRPCTHPSVRPSVHHPPVITNHGEGRSLSGFVLSLVLSTLRRAVKREYVDSYESVSSCPMARSGGRRLC